MPELGVIFAALAIIFWGFAGCAACMAGGQSDDELQRAIIRDLAVKRGGDGYFVDGKCAGIDERLCLGCCIKQCLMFDQSLPENQPTKNALRDA